MPAQTNKLTINGRQYEFTPTETLLDIAKRVNIDIPFLCFLKDIPPLGACRICVVELEGSDSLVPACSTRAQEGMRVLTESEKICNTRRTILELLFASGNHDYPSSLHDYAKRYNIDPDRLVKIPCKYPKEDVNPFIVRDFSQCIKCGKCIAACNRIQVNEAIAYGYRGADLKVVARGDLALKESDCVFCGECVQACPTGALIDKHSPSASEMDKAKKVRTTCGYCGVGCQIDFHVKDNRILQATGAETAQPNKGRLCVKGRYAFDFVHHPDRLKHPLIRENGEFRKADWDEALTFTAQRLKTIKQDHGKDSLGVLASARMTNEENYIAQKFARTVLKTNNIDHCARLCHASTVAGLAAAFGSGAMTNPIQDVSNSDVVLLTGSNPTENHPVAATYIKQAVKFGKTILIVADPRDIGIARFADIRLNQRPGTDAAWINGLMHIIIKENLHDADFIKERTEDFNTCAKAVETYTPDHVEEITGIPKNDLISAARLYAKAQAASIIYCMGITQHTTGTDNVKSLANLAMLCGNMGIPGGGVNPLRGQNNVQGACDMGALPNVLPEYK
jgi:predicted molibdopterin-dependent oxidoreductase YjgC